MTDILTTEQRVFIRVELKIQEKEVVA